MHRQAKDSLGGRDGVFAVVHNFFRVLAGACDLTYSDIATCQQHIGVVPKTNYKQLLRALTL
jgi:hypothetical protein